MSSSVSEIRMKALDKRFQKGGSKVDPQIQELKKLNRELERCSQMT
jgi:hypothetical protein